ncbi:MAG: preprotein translocase subunit SecG [Candidatus Peribacteraceae bacterium]|nr:preprotein translocase subunit SecG [Candidatus Peribacteraceae bacterium]
MLVIIHVIVALFLSLFILLQHRASGLSATFGGSGAMVVQRRGAERFIYLSTGWLSGAFFALSILQWYLR